MFEKLSLLREKLGLWVWVILIILVGVTWWAISTLNKTVKVDGVKVSRGDIVQTVSTSGNVTADRYSVLSFQTGGKVVSVGVKSGDVVKKGQLIAKLDTVPLNATYQEALNTYRKYQATAQNILDQVKDHSGDETFAQKDSRTTAEVNRDNAYDAVKSAESDLKNATIFAPFAGVMDMVTPSSPGVNVLLGAAKYTIVDPSSVYFDAEAEETDLPNISVGQRVNLKLDSYPEEDIQGVVENIGMVAFISSTGGNAYHVRVRLPENINEKFRVGMGGDADIVFNTIQDTLKVPASSVVIDNVNYVWVVKDGRAKKVEVEIGGSSVDEVAIKSGLTGDETIISQPTSSLKDNLKVSL